MNETKKGDRGGYSRPDWEHHYETDDLRWDLGDTAPPFVQLWKEEKIPPGKVIVPGCGRGHEVLFLAERGFQVTAVDFARGAVDSISRALAERGLPGQVLHQDFFELESGHDGRFDLMLEHTFFCAISPVMRMQYVAIAGRLLKPEGLLIGLFYETGEEGGPPFNTTRDDIVSCFSDIFRIESLDKTSHSAEQRQNKEWLALLKKK